MQASLNGDSYRCATSLRSELRIVKKLLRLTKKCLCPKFKSHAFDLEQRRVKLMFELKIRADEEHVLANFNRSEAYFRVLRRSQRA